MGEEDEEHKRRRDHADAAKAERRLNVPEREVVPPAREEAQGAMVTGTGARSIVCGAHAIAPGMARMDADATNVGDVSAMAARMHVW
eukprot:2553766-Prymnesium_polylepis.1